MSNSKVRNRKIRVKLEDKDMEKDIDEVQEIEEVEEEKLDKELETEDNMSFAVMALILVVCFVVGILVGYLLYRLAIDNSNTLSIINNFKHII